MFSSDSPTPHVAVVYGTRPEAVKLASTIECLRAASVQTTVISSGQHRELLAPIETFFDLAPRVRLDVMRAKQPLNALLARLLTALDGAFAEVCPDWVVVQGDTTTALAAAMAAFQRQVAVAHVEAGLRSGDLSNPFPEEANRRLIAPLAHLHFAPTERNRQALEAEGIAPDHILITGNPVVDALFYAVERIDQEPAPGRRWLHDGSDGQAVENREPIVLLTLHRRELTSGHFDALLEGLARVAGEWPDQPFVFPVHPSPAVREPVEEVLGCVPNVELLEPLSYPEMVAAMRQARLIVTDSGGIQEEAPTFGTPVLVLRTTTERQEALDEGMARLVGTDPAIVQRELSVTLEGQRSGSAPARTPFPSPNPFGDGKAGERIVKALLDWPRST